MNPLDKKIQKSLKYSILDGSFASAMVGFGESFFSAFAVFLKAGTLNLAFLGSLPPFLGSSLQLLSNKLLDFFRSRKKIVCLGVLLQALMFIPIALVFFFGEFRIWHLIIFISIYRIFGSLMGPAWSSWMGDLVDEKARGKYFGRRNRITGFTSFISFLTAGMLLQKFSGDVKTQYFGFALLFGIAFLSRLISLFFLTKKYEPEYQSLIEEEKFSFWQFLKQARFRNYGLFVIYLSFMNFGVYLAAPFFTPYMLYDLKFNYITFTIISAAATIVKLVMMPIWGSLSDKYGTKKVLAVTGFLMPLVPLPWIFSKNILYLIIIQFYSGFAWAGFEIAASNFIFDCTSPKKRATCVAYYNVLNGMTALLGGIVGGVLVKYNHLFWSKYYFVFILSFVIRYVASIIFIPKIKEVRMVEEIPYRKLLFQAVTTMPTQGIINNLITLRNGKKKS